MAIRCARCGTFLNDNERFCPNCGENVMNNQPQQNTYQQNAYQQPAYQQNIQPPPAAYVAPDEPPMTTKRWVGTILLTTCLGIVSWVLLFVWGFGSGPKERQNYCKAMLIAKAIMLGVGMLFGVFFSAAFFGIIGEIVSEVADYSDFYTAASLCAILG